MQASQATPFEQAPPQGPAIADDEALASQARRDPQAFATLYQRHVRRVYRYHLVRTGDVDDAQDLTSQTFLAALEGIGDYRSRGSFCGWLFGIANHKVADHYRRRRPDAPLDSAEALCDPDPSPEERVTTHLQLDQAVRALQSLPPDQAQALTLRILGGLSAAEVGEVMDRSEAAVKMLVHRGLRTLREGRPPDAEVSL